MFDSLHNVLATKSVDASAFDANDGIVATEALIAECKAELGEAFDENALMTSMEELELDMTNLDADLENLEMHGNTVDDLTHLHNVISTEGLSPSLIKFVDRDQLLSSTILSIPAYETLGGATYAPTDAASIAAAEGVLETVKETVKGWASKAMAFGGKVGSAIASFASAAWAKVKQIGSWVGNLTSQGLEKAKAHPYATALIVAGVLTGGAALGVAIWGGGIPTTAAAFSAWYGKLAGLGAKHLGKNGAAQVTNIVTGKGSGFKAFSQNADKIAAAAKGGWTKNAASALLAKIRGGLTALGNLKTAVTTGLSKAKTNLTNGYVLKWLRVNIRLTWRLIRNHIMGAWRWLVAQFGKLKAASTAAKASAAATTASVATAAV